MKSLMWVTVSVGLAAMLLVAALIEVVLWTLGR